MEALKAIAEVELLAARKERDEATALNWMFQTFIGNPSDVINKARLYDEGTSQLGAPIGVKIVWFLVDYNTKMEKLLKGMQALLQPTGQQ